MKKENAITAESINIVDSTGKVAISISSSLHGGGAGIELIGAKERLLLQVLDDGRVAIILDAPPAIGVVTITTKAVMMMNHSACHPTTEPDGETVS